MDENENIASTNYYLKGGKKAWVHTSIKYSQCIHKRVYVLFIDQLLVLQRQSLADSKYVIPRVKTIEEIDKLTGALRRIDAGKTVVEDPNDCLACIRTTNRCFHATHAYTGIPCAAYSEYARNLHSVISFNRHSDLRHT